MHSRHCRSGAAEPTGSTFDRRTVLTGTASALLGLAFARSGPAEASGARADAPFDPQLARRLQHVLDATVASGEVPGAVLHVAPTGHASWSAAAGLAQLNPNVAIRPDDRVGIGSIAKPFVATVVLQLAEADRFTLDAALPSVLPAGVTSRFPSAPQVTLRMLLGHRSGLPEWDSEEVEVTAARDPAKVWQPAELLDLAAAQPPMFPPGTRYSYSNTNYTLLGMVIEHATGRSWRDEVTDRIVKPLQLAASVLPAPGDRSLGGPHAHGYVEANGQMLDVTTVDPSMAGAAGGNSLVTNMGDLVHFLDALLAGRLFRRPATLQAMLAFQPATGEPGQVGYGLGLLRRVLPGGVETIDHLGGAVGFRAYVARLPRQQVTLATAMNSLADPSLLILPVLQAFAGAGG